MNDGTMLQSTDINSRNSIDRDPSKERDRSRRGDKRSRFSDEGGAGGRDRSRDRKRSSNRRVYVANICYEYRWQDLKDLFRQHVGDVAHVELFVDENDKPRGCGIVEFTDEKAVKKCLEVMHRFDLKGRKLVVREDAGTERDKYGNLTDSKRRDRDNLPDLRDEIRTGGNLPSLMGGGGGVSDQKWGNTYGLSPQFLDELEIRGPLQNRVFIANLDYKVDEKKLLEVFRLAGKVINVELSRDKDGNSRGFAVIEYDHPVESVQAISMLNGQMLYDRKLTVRMDRDKSDSLLKLPEGLKSVGLGLGPNGDPLKDVARNLPQSNSGSSTADNFGSGILGAVPQQALGLGASALSNVVNTAGLASLASTQAAALQASLAVGGLSNQLLSSGLGNVANELGLGSVSNANLNAASLLAASNMGGNAFNNQSSGLGGGMGGNNSSSGMGGSNNYSSNYGSSVGGNRYSSAGSRDYMDSGNRDYDNKNLMSNRNYSQQDSVYNNGNQNRSLGGSGGQSSSGASNRVSDSIYVSNLPPSTTWTNLGDKFRQFGDIVFCEMRGNDSGIIQFGDQRSAKKAVDMMDRARVDGRTIDVRFF